MIFSQVYIYIVAVAIAMMCLKSARSGWKHTLQQLQQLRSNEKICPCRMIVVAKAFGLLVEVGS